MRRRSRTGACKPQEAGHALRCAHLDSPATLRWRRDWRVRVHRLVNDVVLARAVVAANRARPVRIIRRNGKFSTGPRSEAPAKESHDVIHSATLLGSSLIGPDPSLVAAQRLVRYKIGLCCYGHSTLVRGINRWLHGDASGTVGKIGGNENILRFRMFFIHVKVRTLQKLLTRFQ